MSDPEPSRNGRVKRKWRTPSFGELLNGAISDGIGMGHENSLERQRLHLAIDQSPP
jgi:hypothetical protein